MRQGSTSTQSTAPSFIVTASGCAPPIPPIPPVSVHVPRRLPPKCSARHRAEGLVRALQDALRADVDPRAGRHLAVHGEPLPLQLAEHLPRRPARHQVAVGDEHARRVAWVRKTATGFPDWTSIVSSSARSRRVRTIASNASQERAARPVPPYTTRSSGRSATSGSRLFISIRSAASCCQPRQESSGPRGARMVRDSGRASRRGRAVPWTSTAPPPPSRGPFHAAVGDDVRASAADEHEVRLQIVVRREQDIDRRR
jgi:hypothetical protein